MVKILSKTALMVKILSKTTSDWNNDKECSKETKKTLPMTVGGGGSSWVEHHPLSLTHTHTHTHTNPLEDFKHQKILERYIISTFSCLFLFALILVLWHLKVLNS